jgi:transposase
VEPARELAQLQLQFVDQIHWRYALIRPLVLVAEGTPTHRAEETHPPPDTVRTFLRRFRQEGLLGLLPTDIEVAPRPRASRVPEAVRQEIARLKALDHDFPYREIGRMIVSKCGYRLHPKTVKRLWHQSQPAIQEAVALGAYHSQGDRYQARVHVIKLYDQGWTKRSISRVFHVSRPTIARWIDRFEAEHCAGLGDKSCAPKAPARKIWLPLMLEVSHLQKRHPDAGEVRIWSLRGNTEISVRTVGRLMAFNRQVYEAIPHRPSQDTPQDPRPHPDRATAPHEFWFLDGRKMDFALEGVTWWSRIMVDGYSRTHAGRGGGAHGSQLGGADGPLYGVSALWGPPGVNLR